MTKDKKIRVRYFQYAIFIWTFMVNIYIHTKYPIGKMFDPPQEFIVADQITRKTSESERFDEKQSENFLLILIWIALDHGLIVLRN